jgi:hypothetical protein
MLLCIYLFIHTHHAEKCLKKVADVKEIYDTKPILRVRNFEKYIYDKVQFLLQLRLK